MDPKDTKKEILSLKERPGPRKAKEFFDAFFIFIIMAVSMPLMILIVTLLFIESLLFKDAREPVLYREVRVSLDKEFILYKFRITRKSAVDRKRKEKGRIRTLKGLEHDDRNLTPFGKYLKKFYLDEMPQLLNVLRGDIGIVGPRPVARHHHYMNLKKGETGKAMIKSGLTGLVQVSKGTSTHTNNLDYEYIYKYMHYTPARLFLYDLCILGKTALLVMKKKGL